MSDPAPEAVRRSPRLSLRLRLTLWVVALFAIIQVSLSVVFFLYERGSVDAFFSTRLRLRSQLVADALADRAPDITDASLAEMAREALNFVVFEGFAIMVYDDQGRLVASSQQPPPDVGAATLDRALANPEMQIVNRPVSFIEGTAPDAGEARVAVVGFRGEDTRRYVLITATADTYARRILALAANVLIASLPIGIVATSIAGWFIAGLAVAPLRKIRALATEMSPERLDQEVQFDSSATELLHLEAEWDRMRRRMEAAFMAKERFMANVSHELKTPISVLLTESQILDLKRAPDDVRAFVSSAQEELRRLSRLVDSFLMLTRAVDSRASLTSECHVNDLVMESVEECTTWAALHHVYIVPSLLSDDDTLDTTIEGDANLLRTMLNNLVLNATRFSPPHDKVTVTPRVEDGIVMISVRDRGPGIPEALIGRVFDRFVQADEERRLNRGHGLGLEIARGIAEIHHGEIRVFNCDPGCEFVACIPRTQPKDAQGAPTEQAEPETARLDDEEVSTCSPEE